MKPSLDLPYAELKPGRGGAAGVAGIGWRLLLHKPLVLCANSALYLIFLAYFSVVEIATNHQTTHYWEFATGLLLLSYAGTAIGIVAFIGFRGLVVNGQGHVSEERAQRIKYLLSVVQDSINNVTAGFTFAAVLALCAAAQKTLNLHPTSQYAADPAVFWAYAMWAASASIALIWALQALMLDPLKAAAAASKSGTAAGAGDGARPRSDTGLARYEGLRAEVALAVGQHLFEMTVGSKQPGSRPSPLGTRALASPVVARFRLTRLLNRSTIPPPCLHRSVTLWAIAAQSPLTTQSSRCASTACCSPFASPRL